MATATAGKTKKVLDGRYEVGSVIGRGAKSVVYEARVVTNPSQRLALKVLLNGESQNATTERLRREALALVSCRHAYVVRLDDFHSTGQLSYLALEYAELGDLRQYAARTDITVDTAERFLKQALEALAYIHRAGIIHRDLKPENILVASEKEIRITDFGVALLPGEEASLADLQSGVGTMNYMAPEIIEGKQLDARADLYAVGVIFYELLAKKNPFEAAPLARQLDLRKEESFEDITSVNTDTPDYLNKIILQAMSYDPDKRFATADLMLQALIDGHSAAFEKSSKSERAKVSKVKRPKTVPLHKRYKYLEAEREAEKLFKELFGDDADWLKTAGETDASLTSTEKSATALPFAEGALKELDAVVAKETDTPPGALFEEPALEPNIQFEPSVEAPEDAVQPLQQDPVLREEEENFDTTQENLESFHEASPQSSAQPEPDSNAGDTEQSAVSTQQKAKSTWTKYIVPLLILLVIAWITPTVLRGVSSVVSGIAHVGASILPFKIFSSEDDGAILPATTSALEGSIFPQIPNGMYHGTIKGLLGNGELPLTVIADSANARLGFIIHLAGFRPVWVSTADLAEGSPVRFSSQGIVIEIAGQVVENEIIGFYKNLVSGRQGSWTVK